MVDADLNIVGATNLPDVVNKALGALSRYTQGVQTAQAKSGGAVGNLNAGFISEASRQMESITRRLATDVGQLQGRINTAIAAAGQGGKVDPAVGANIGQQVRSLGVAAAASLRDVVDVAVKGGLDPKIGAEVAARGASLIRVTTDQLFSTIAAQIETAKKQLNVTGVTGLGKPDQQGQRTVPNAASLESGAQRPGPGNSTERSAIEAGFQRVVLAQQQQAQAAQAAAAATQQAANQQQTAGQQQAAASQGTVDAQREYQRVLREATAAEAAYQAARRDALARAKDPRAGVDVDRRTFGAHEVGEGLYRDNAGRLWENPREAAPEGGGPGRRIGEQLVEIERDMIDDLDQFVTMSADERHKYLTNLREQGRLNKVQTAEEKKHTEEVTERARIAGQYNRMGLDQDILGGSATRIAKTPVVVRGDEVWDANLKGDQATRVTNPERINIAREDLARQLRKEAAAAAKSTAATNKLAAQRAAAGGVGGRGGGGGLQDALFGDGPGGTGGGLFTSQRLLRQGASFGGYMISAALIGGSIKAVIEAKKEVLDYVDSVTELKLALGQTTPVNESFVNSLQNLSKYSGSNVGETMDTAARAVRAFSNQRDPDEVREAAAMDVTQAATHLAVLARQDLPDAAGNIIAIGKAFGIAADNLGRVNDAVAVSRNAIGGTSDVIGQALAAVAPAAAEAGFSMQETAALISAIQRDTDGTALNIGTRLTRIWSTVGGSGGRNAIRQLNSQLDPSEQIDMSGGVRNTFDQLIRKYDDLTESQQGLIRNQIGGFASTRELIAILNNYDDVLAAVEEGQESAGQGMAEFKLRAHDLAGMVKRVAGEAKNIIVELFNSGVFDIFAVGLRTLEPLLTGVRKLLELYNMLPRPLKTMIALTGELVVLNKLLMATGIGAKLSGALLPAPQLGMIAGAKAGAAGLSGAALYTAGGAGKATAAASVVAGSKSLVAALKAAAAAVTAFASRMWAVARTPVSGASLGQLGAVAAVAGLIISEVAKATSAIIREVDKSRAEMGRQVEGSSAKEYEEAAANMMDRAEQARQSSGGWVNAAINWVTGDLVSAVAEPLEERARYLVDAANRIDEARTASARSPDTAADAISFLVDGGVKEGLDMLASSGRSAETQIDALIESIRALGSASDEEATRLKPGQELQFAVGLADRLTAELADYQDLMHTPYGLIWDKDVRERRNIHGLLADMDLGEFARAVEDDITSIITKAPDGEITDDVQAAITEVYIARLRQFIGANEFDKLPEQIQENLLAFIPQIVKGELGEFAGANVDPEAILKEIDEAIAAAPGLAKGAGDEVGIRTRRSGQRGADVAAAKAALAKMTEFRDAAAGEATDTQLEKYDILIQDAELAVASALISRAQSLAKLATAARPLDDAVGRLDEEIIGLQESIDAAIDADQIAELESQLYDAERNRARAVTTQVNARRMAQLDPRDTIGQALAEYDAVMREINDFLAEGDDYSAAYWQAQRRRAEADRNLIDLRRKREHARQVTQVDPRDTVGRLRLGVAQAREDMDAEIPGSQEYWEARERWTQAIQAAAAEDRRYAAASRAALRDPASTLQQARDAVLDAKDNVRGQIPNTIAFFEAMEELNKAQVEMADELARFASNRRLLTVDITDPVLVAKEDARQATEALKRARQRGAPEDVLAELELEKRRADNALEDAAARQRLGDLQTDVDLGRITQQQYNRVLNEWANQLKAIPERTRQQQELLNDIEKALKSSTDSLNGMWNIGDIKVPTPFEVRRAIAAGNPGFAGTNFDPNSATTAVTLASATTAVTNNTNNVTINGTDINKVREVLNQLLGQQGQGRTTAGTSGTRRL